MTPEKMPPGDSHSNADESVFAALEELCTLRDEGETIDRQLITSRYPEVADEILRCIHGMDLIEATAREFRTPSKTETSGLPRLEELGAKLGDYELIRELGRGGMGVVYEAKQVSMGRRVALKVLPFAALLDPRQLLRFRNEARAAGGLHHRNIVPVFSVGTERGVHYYAMQYVEGPSLADVLEGLGPCGPTETTLASPSDKPKSDTIRDIQAAISTKRSTSPQEYLRTVADWGRQAAEALAYAHENGVLHRDIKPANLLLDSTGSLLVADFGLAKLESDASVTMSGDVLGTLRYMAPEQALGIKVLIDQRVDIYSLGVTLYELATRQPAFSGDDREELLRKVSSEEPIRPSRLEPAIPKDFETIILKAASKFPADRYLTAQDLANDLNRFLAHESIVARPPSYLDRLRKWGQQHPATITTTAILLLLVSIGSLIGLSWASHKNIQLAEARNAASAEAKRAHEALELARNVVDTFYLDLGIKWIADESAPSNFQSTMIDEAANFYQELSAQPIKQDASPRDLELITSGFDRVGQIQHYLSNFDDAVAAYERCIDTLQNTYPKPLRAPIRSQLAKAYYHKGQSLAELAQYDEAIRSYDEATRHVSELVEADIDGTVHHYLVNQVNLARAVILTKVGSLAEAGRLAESSRKGLTAIRRQADVDETMREMARLDVMRADLCRARIMAYEGNFVEASKLSDLSLKKVGVRRTADHDDVPLREIQIDLQELAAETAELSEDLSRAAEEYRLVLEMRRHGLPGGLEPEHFFMESLFKKSTNMDGQIQFGPFCEYVETNMKLANLLRRMDQPYAAENILGECRTVTAVLVAERPNSLRYQIADANTWTLAAALLSESRPAEAIALFRHAQEVWAQILQTFPHAERFVSSVYGLTRDFQRFQLTTRELDDLLNSPGEPFGESNAYMGTVFYQHSSGLAWAHIKRWSEAIARFESSLAMRKKNHEYDWLQLAIVHSQNGQSEKANEFIAMARRAIGARDGVDPELQQLLDTACDVVVKKRTTND